MSPPLPGDPVSPEASRRSFLKGIGTSAVAAAASRVEAVASELAQANAEKVHGPGAVPVTLRINGKEVVLHLEPRVTLLDALRNYSNHTGAKEVCDRGTCGACTVLLDDIPIYSCMKLAIDSQGRGITTVEGIAQSGRLSSLQQSFVDADALMCGYCTPGFVMSLTALLKRNPKPSLEEIGEACEGNLCRCGTYPRVMAAAQRAAGIQPAERVEIIQSDEYAALAKRTHAAG